MASTSSISSGKSETEVSNLLKLAGKAVEDLQSQAGRVGPNLALARDLGQTVLANGLVNDRNYLNERIIQLAASLPNDSGLRDDLSGAFIKTLWNNLQHPPISYLGDAFKYRTADGSNNNIMYPQLGAGGSHYARSAVNTHLRTTNLPDPGLIFDTLLRREGAARPHPTKVSSHLFYFATIIIHDIFRTDEADQTKVVSSSYLDLGPLYGHNQTQQNAVRAFKDGLLKKDTFAEWRLLGQPPGACALMIAFNRFHNYVVGQIAAVNENGRFSLPAGLTPDSDNYEKAVAKRDNDLFQTGRLITCGLYVNIILNDYLRTILNLNDNPINSNWALDPRSAFSSVFDSQGTPRGVGNQVSAEFNFIYRWHCATSDRDEKWINDFMNKIAGKVVDASALSTTEFLTILRTWASTNLPRDPSQWTFNDFTRKEDGSFADTELIGLLTAATDTVAGAFGARNVPAALKAIEILGIQQGRDWGMASFNEFRAFFKLKPFASFTEINSDAGVAEALEALYGHPDNVELYPGLMAEEAKVPWSPGSGLCPSFTISEAILSDAVTLVRGDRFYSVEYGPQSLTSFGFKEVSSDFDVAGGGVMYKLLMRAFPGWYRPNNIYALYPFNTPDRTKEVFAKRGVPHQIPLDYSVPQSLPQPIPVMSYQDVASVLADQKNFNVTWGAHISQLTGHDFMLSGDAPSNAAQRNTYLKAIYQPKNILSDVRKYYEDITTRLIRENKRKLGPYYQIDIVKDIGNIAHTLFTASFFDIPLKSAASAPGPGIMADELYSILAQCFTYVFLDLDEAKSYKNLVISQAGAKKLAAVVRESVQTPGLLQKLVGLFFNEEKKSGPAIQGAGKALLARILDGEKGAVDDVVAGLIPVIVAVGFNAQAWARLIDIYLSDEYKEHWPAIVALSQSDSPDAWEKLRKYTLEGFRLFPPSPGLLRLAPNRTNIPNTSTTIPTNSPVFVNLTSASRDPAKFPDPDAVKLDRPEASYINYGWGPHTCIGNDLATTGTTAMLRAFARECGTSVQRAPGAQGEMRRVLDGVVSLFLADDGSSWEVLPQGKRVLFDAVEKQIKANGKNGHANGTNGHANGRH